MRTGRVLLGVGAALAIAAPTVGVPRLALAATGTITINEVSNPVADPGKFNLQIDAATAGTGGDVSNGGTTGGVVVTSSPSPGTAHTVGETAGTATNLINYQTSTSCTDGTLTQTANGTAPMTVSVTDGSSITCTITNIAIVTGGGAKPQNVLGSGSDTTQFMMQSLDGLYLFSPGCASIPTPSGPTAWLDLSCQANDPVAIAHTATSTSGSATVTIADTTKVLAGQLVAGPGVPADTYIGQGTVVANTSFGLSSSPSSNVPVNATAAAGTGTFNFLNIFHTENYNHDQVHEAYFIGSGGGIKQLCNQGKPGIATIDFARSSRSPVTGDCAGLDFTGYARDGITWETFNVAGAGTANFTNVDTTNCPGTTPPGGLTQLCLTQAQLQGIYVTCSIKKWQDINTSLPASPVIPIDIYTPQKNSGTRVAWDLFLGGGTTPADSTHCMSTAQQATNIVAENQNQSVVDNGDAANAIVPFSVGIWNNQVNFSGNAQLGAIDNTYPSNTTILSGSFPGGRFLYNVTCRACSGPNSAAAVTNYVGPTGWLCKGSASHALDPVNATNFRSEIATAISNAGFVPLGFSSDGIGHASFCRVKQT